VSGEGMEASGVGFFVSGEGMEASGVGFFATAVSLSRRRAGRRRT
jgi:hypothetical protein